jgi:hypothetical protein
MKMCPKKCNVLFDRYLQTSMLKAEHFKCEWKWICTCKNQCYFSLIFTTYANNNYLKIF